MQPMGVLGLERIGGGELLIVLLIILVLFGGSKLPGLARSLGRSIGEFKKGREEGATAAREAEEARKKDGAAGTGTSDGGKS